MPCGPGWAAPALHAGTCGRADNKSGAHGRSPPRGPEVPMPPPLRVQGHATRSVHTGWHRQGDRAQRAVCRAPVIMCCSSRSLLISSPPPFCAAGAGNIIPILQTRTLESEGRKENGTLVTLLRAQMLTSLHPRTFSTAHTPLIISTQEV